MAALGGAAASAADGLEGESPGAPVQSLESKGGPEMVTNTPISEVSLAGTPSKAPIFEGSAPAAEDAQILTQAAELTPDPKDLEPLLKLLEKPPDEVTAWAFEQMKSLAEQKAKGEIESLPIFKVAAALKVAPTDKKEALISSLMQGVGGLPVEQRADAMRLLADLPSADVDKLSVSSSSSQASAAEIGANFARLGKEAGFTDMTSEELQTLAQVVEKEQGQLIQPLLDVVPQLSEDERNQITDALVSKGVVSKENRAMVEETVKPGGLADQFASMMKWVAVFFKYTWLVWALPLAEGIAFLAFCFVAGCVVSLVTWLLVDTLCGSLFACLAYGVKQALAESYKEFSENPMAMGKQVQASLAEGVKFDDAVPGAKPAKYLGGVMVGIILLQCAFVVLGLINLAGTLAGPCNTGPVFFSVVLCTAVMALRVLAPVGVVIFVARGVKKVNELKEQASSRVSQPLMSAAEATYGATQTEEDKTRARLAATEAEVPV